MADCAHTGRNGSSSGVILATLLLLVSSGLAAAQGTSTTAFQSAPLPRITLDEAIARARANEPAFAAALAASRVSALDRSIAVSALLPGMVYHNQYIYTQGATGPTGSGNASAGSTSISGTPRFIANNTVHEYVSQGVVSETIGVQQVTAVSRASAAAAVARAELEIARRGLVSTVVRLFYGALAAERKLEVAQRASQEASGFTTLTKQREDARESARADVVKAQLQQQQRDRDVQDAKLTAEKSKLELAVLLFADPRTAFTLSLPAVADLPNRPEVEVAAAKANPELNSAMSSLRVSALGVRSARAAYLPDLGVSFGYGIDAAEFAVNGRGGVRNLGYSATATLDVPVWDWLSTAHKVKQAEIQRDAAKVTLTAAQRRLVAQLDESYSEATVARDQMQSFTLSAQTAEESLKLTRLRYTAGEATVLEVVDAQNSFTSAEIAQADGIVRYQTALADLQLLTGTF